MIRTAFFVIATAVFLIATTPNAAAAPIFPPLVSGEYAFGVRTAAVELDENGVPTTPPTFSIGIRRVDVEGAPLLLCVDAGAGELVSVRVTVPVSGSRAELRAVAFNALGCETYESERSDDGAYVFFVPPGAPTLELLSPTPPVP